MKKKIFAFIAAMTMAFSITSCSKDSGGSESSVSESSSSVSESSEEETTETVTEDVTEEPTTVHVSPVETISSSLGSQITLNKTIERTDGSNTCSIPLSDLVEDGDVITSFTFVIYSGDGSNIGTFKGGCGISVTDGCSSATDEGWYQSEDFSAQTEGTYGEITWNVPSEVRDYINTGGEVLFGYWWGNAESIRVDSVICTYTRTKEIPVDGMETMNTGKSVNYSDTDNTIAIPFSDIIPDDVTPQAVVFNISSGGSLGKFTGAFGIDSSEGYYQSGDVAVFTDSSSLSLTWILSDEAKKYATNDGKFILGYWWSDQPSITLDSVTVKYSAEIAVPAKNDKETSKAETSTVESNNNGDFRSAKEIVSAIKVGWNLGNTLECYDYSSWTNNAETAWGNPKTTEAMIKSVKDSGFNAIRIPVTWGEHMNGNNIDTDWMNRVQEVVDYAYDQNMFVILNMHHDDYIWFTPSESEYSSDSEKLCSIWSQICDRFGDYGDRLIFEGMNEPRTVGSSKEWIGGTPEERAVINKYEQNFVDTVRASGGNNAYRTLVVTSYAASIDQAAVNDVIVPNDSNVIVSIHYYSPWDFANGDSTQWGTDSDKSTLDAGFKMLKEKFIDKGTPVIIGEFGATAASSDSVRAPYLEYYISSASDYGIKCFIWDNGVSSGESSFGIFDRSSLTWNTSLLNGIMNGAT